MAPLRASLARSPPRLGRSQAGGLHPQDPQGCAPWCAFAHRAPAASVIQPEGFRARVRPVAGVVNRLRLSTLDAQPLAVFGLREKFKGGPCVCTAGFGACPRCRATVGNRPRRWAARCSRRLCPPSTDWARLSTGDRVQGAAVEAVWLSLLKTRIKSAWPES